MPFFVLVFGIAFGRPLVPIFKIWGSFQGAFWNHFDYFSQMLRNLTNETFFSEMLDLGGAGPPFLHVFC